MILRLKICPAFKQSIDDFITPSAGSHHGGRFPETVLCIDIRSCIEKHIADGQGGVNGSGGVSEAVLLEEVFAVTADSSVGGVDRDRGARPCGPSDIKVAGDGAGVVLVEPVGLEGVGGGVAVVGDRLAVAELIVGKAAVVARTKKPRLASRLGRLRGISPAIG